MSQLPPIFPPTPLFPASPPPPSLSFPPCYPPPLSMSLSPPILSRGRPDPTILSSPALRAVTPPPDMFQYWPSGDIMGNVIIEAEDIRLHLLQPHCHHSLVQRWVDPPDCHVPHSLYLQQPVGHPLVEPVQGPPNPGGPNRSVTCNTAL